VKVFFNLKQPLFDDQRRLLRSYIWNPDKYPLDVDIAEGILNILDHIQDHIAADTPRCPLNSNRELCVGCSSIQFWDCPEVGHPNR
jgi:hypothetical protein